jgi:predicted RNA-binding Zn ribbon-like protein
VELTLQSVSERVERQPGDRAPAPGDLRVVQAFVNTFWDLDDNGRDQFESPEALCTWLLKWDLIEPGVHIDHADVHRAVDVREGLRALLFINNGSEAAPDAIARLNDALRGPGLFVQLDAGGRPQFKTQRAGADAAIALIATVVAVAQLDGRFSRLKACPGTHCGWAFYDHSRNKASSWCAMSICGSRAKAREYRRRKRRGEG